MILLRAYIAVRPVIIVRRLLFTTKILLGLLFHYTFVALSRNNIVPKLHVPIYRDIYIIF